MVKVTVLPSGGIIEVAEDEVLMASAEREGWQWPTTCHGDAECLFCWVEIVEGGKNAISPHPREAAALEVLERRRLEKPDPLVPVRLACQLRFSGAAVVRRRGIKAPN